MIRQVLVAISLLTTPALGGEIFRWVDADGRTHFSDRRPPDAAVQRITPDIGPSDSEAADASPQPAGSAPRLGPYSLFSILSPATGAVLEQPIDTLEISLQLEPPLQEGHRLELLLDGRPIPMETAATRLRIEGVGFEVHRLQARIQDATGEAIAVTPVHELELRQVLPPGVLP
jgi:hypothetical protein